MTWSITPPALRGGNPIVRWDGRPLRSLSDAELETAIRAANALGSDVLDQAAENGPNGTTSMTGEAANIVAAIVIEMDRRGVDNVRERAPKIQNAAEPQTEGDDNG